MEELGRVNGQGNQKINCRMWLPYEVIIQKDMEVEKNKGKKTIINTIEKAGVTWYYFLLEIQDQHCDSCKKISDKLFITKEWYEDNLTKLPTIKKYNIILNFTKFERQKLLCDKCFDSYKKGIVEIKNEELI